jgi:ABC-type antimicrobial peptide transport system permease subunit
MACSVGQRTQEIGLRKALGAAPGHVLGLVLRQGLLLAGVGVVLGVAGALGMSQLVGSLLFGSAHDPLSFIGASAALVAVAALASLLPALRASRVDPLVALKES